jgi:DNA-damage-inducible protein J
MHKIAKAATVNTRIEPALKTKAEIILNKVGLSSAEAIRLFYTQICLRKGLPFDIKIPNKKTLKAMQDADTGKTYKVKSVKDLFDSLK